MFGKNGNLSKSVSDTKKTYFKPNQGEILLNAGNTECYQNTCHCDFGKRQMLGDETMGGLAKNFTGHMGWQEVHFTLVKLPSKGHSGKM